jgi:hypothetical protein
LFTLSFETEKSYDTLTVGGVDYSGTLGPKGIFLQPGTLIQWKSDTSTQKKGWHLCNLPVCKHTDGGIRNAMDCYCNSKSIVCTQQTGRFCHAFLSTCSDAPIVILNSTKFYSTGTCSVNKNCVTSFNYGVGEYDNNAHCLITALGDYDALSVVSFDTNGMCDQLIVGGVIYYNNNAPMIGVKYGDSLLWQTDGSEVKGGFKVCIHERCAVVDGSTSNTGQNGCL